MNKRKSTDTPNIIDFITDPQLLGLSLSPAQETFLRSIDRDSARLEEL